MFAHVFILQFHACSDWVKIFFYHCRFLVWSGLCFLILCDAISPCEILNICRHLKSTRQGWGEYSTYEYEYWKISTRVVLEYNVFSIFMFIILGKTSTRVVLAPALQPGHYPLVAGRCLQLTLVTVMVMNDWLLSLLFSVNQPSHSWDTAIFFFLILPWKSMVKAMHMIKGQGHNVGSATNRFTSFSFHICWPCHSWDTVIY